MGKRLLEELAGHISATRSMLPASDAKLGMGMLSFTVDQERFVLAPEQLGKDKYQIRENAALLLREQNADTYVIGGLLASGVRRENFSQDYEGSLHDHPDAYEVMLFVGGDDDEIGKGARFILWHGHHRLTRFVGNCHLQTRTLWARIS